MKASAASQNHRLSSRSAFSPSTPPIGGAGRDQAASVADGSRSGSSSRHAVGARSARRMERIARGSSNEDAGVSRTTSIDRSSTAPMRTFGSPQQPLPSRAREVFELFRRTDAARVNRNRSTMCAAIRRRAL